MDDVVKSLLDRQLPKTSTPSPHSPQPRRSGSGGADSTSLDRDDPDAKVCARRPRAS